MVGVIWIWVHHLVDKEENDTCCSFCLITVGKLFDKHCSIDFVLRHNISAMLSRYFFQKVFSETSINIVNYRKKKTRLEVRDCDKRWVKRHGQSKFFYSSIHIWEHYVSAKYCFIHSICFIVISKFQNFYQNGNKSFLILRTIHLFCKLPPEQKYSTHIELNNRGENLPSLQLNPFHPDLQGQVPSTWLHASSLQFVEQCSVQFIP